MGDDTSLGHATGPPWEACSHSARQEIHIVLWKRYIIVFAGTTAGNYLEPDESNPHHILLILRSRLYEILSAVTVECAALQSRRLLAMFWRSV